MKLASDNLQQRLESMESRMAALEGKVQQQAIDAAYMDIHSNWTLIRWYLVREQDLAGEGAEAVEGPAVFCRVTLAPNPRTQPKRAPIACLTLAPIGAPPLQRHQMPESQNSIPWASIIKVYLTWGSTLADHAKHVHLFKSARPSARAPWGRHEKRLVRGKPLGGRRPAWARLPIQAARSVSVRVRAPRLHDSPAARWKVVISDSPPSR